MINDTDTKPEMDFIKMCLVSGLLLASCFLLVLLHSISYSGAEPFEDVSGL